MRHYDLAELEPFGQLLLEEPAVPGLDRLSAEVFQPGAP